MRGWIARRESNAATRGVQRSEFIRVHRSPCPLSLSLSLSLSLFLVFPLSPSLFTGFTRPPLLRSSTVVDGDGDAGSRQFKPVRRRWCLASTTSPASSRSPSVASALLPELYNRQLMPEWIPTSCSCRVSDNVAAVQAERRISLLFVFCGMRFSSRWRNGGERIADLRVFSFLSSFQERELLGAKFLLPSKATRKSGRKVRQKTRIPSEMKIFSRLSQVFLRKHFCFLISVYVIEKKHQRWEERRKNYGRMHPLITSSLIHSFLFVIFHGRYY